MFGSIQLNGPNWVFDFYVARINPDGEFLWVNEVPESTDISGDASIGKLNNCNIDSENNICVTGFIRGEVDWGNGMVTTSTDIGYDLLVVKYNDEGEVIMTKYGGGIGFDKAISGVIDSNDNIYVAGFGFDTIAFDDLETYYDGYYPFLIKLNNENIVTNVQNLESNNSLQIFPNPVSNIVNIKLNGIKEALRLLHLLDVNGSVLKEVESLNSNIEIDLSQFASGIYFIKIQTIENNVYRQKIVKL